MNGERRRELFPLFIAICRLLCAFFVMWQQGGHVCSAPIPLASQGPK